MKIINPANLSPKGIKNIIFDWGGVITNLDFDVINRSFQALGIKNIVQYFTHGSELFLFDFEVAKISPMVFRDKMREIAQQELSDEAIDEAWNSLLRDTPIARLELIRKLSRKYRVFLLSNTNSIHADFYNQKLLSDYGFNHKGLFENVYYSHCVGLRKPSADIFKYVLKDAELIPEETVFIDDTEMHVDAASALNIKAFYLSAGLDITSVFKHW